MSEFFGPLSPAVLVAIVTGLTQAVKSWLDLDGKIVKALALALSYLFLAPYHVINQWLVAPPEDTAQIAWVVFQALVYPLLGWLTATGAYHLVLQPLKRPEPDELPA